MSFKKIFKIAKKVENGPQKVLAFGCTQQPKAGLLHNIPPLPDLVGVICKCSLYRLQTQFYENHQTPRLQPVMTYNELFTRVLPGLGVPDVWACSLGARETRPGLFLFPNEALIRIPFFWIWTTGYMSGETSSKHCSMATSLRLNMTLPSAQVMLIRSPGFRFRSKRMERHCSKLRQ